MVTTTEVAVTSTLPERSNRLRKTVLAWEWLYSLPMRWAIMRYSELAMSVSSMSKSTFMPTMEERVYMEELDGLGDSVFDEHALRVARHPFDRTEFAMVGQQDGRLLVSQFHHGQLAEIALVAGEGHAFFQHFGIAINPGQRRQADPPPGGIRLTVDVLQHLARTPAQGDEADAFPIQLRKLLVGGELRVKNQFGGRL